MDCRFPKEERLRSKVDISRVFQSPCRVTCFGARMVFCPNQKGKTRIVFTLVRKYGNSVQRNRAKRVAKEAFRMMKSQVKPGFDCVIVLYPGKDGYAERKQQISELFRKAELFFDPDLDS